MSGDYVASASGIHATPTTMQIRADQRDHEEGPTTPASIMPTASVFLKGFFSDLGYPVRARSAPAVESVCGDGLPPSPDPRTDSTGERDVGTSRHVQTTTLRHGGSVWELKQQPGVVAHGVFLTRRGVNDLGDCPATQ